jgi:hypothetical protein
MTKELAQKISTSNKNKNKYVAMSCDSRECGKGIPMDESLDTTAHIYDESTGCYVCLKCGKEVKV